MVGVTVSVLKYLIDLMFNVVMYSGNEITNVTKIYWHISGTA